MRLAASVACATLHVLLAGVIGIGHVQAQDRPLIFAPGSLSDERWQWRITFTPDSSAAYFAVSEGFFPATRSAGIVVANRTEEGSWSEPEIATFSGQHADMDPFITPDGKRLYFSSDRPVDGESRDDMNIWFMDREGDGWGEPAYAGSNVNSELDELYPSASEDGTLYFASGPRAPEANMDWNIYFARLAPESNGGVEPFARRSALERANTDLPFDPNNPTADWEFNPEISADGQALVFTSLRPGGYGYGDLYASCRAGEDWSEPHNLGPVVNTADDEFHPTLSRDGGTLYFGRAVMAPEREPSDFYIVSTSDLDLCQ